jgi:hypothetical protein
VQRHAGKPSRRERPPGGGLGVCVTSDWDLDEDLGTARQQPWEAIERAVLGMALQGGNRTLENVSILRGLIGDTGAFYDTRHARIWRSILRLADEGVPPEPVAVYTDLERNPSPGTRRIDALEVSELAAQSPVAVAGTVRHHAQELIKTQILRTVREEGMRLVQSTQDGDLERAEDIRQRALSALAGIGSARTLQEDSWTPVNLSDALDGGDGVAPPRVMGRSDGVFMLYPGRVHMCAGEPEAGKSWVALAAAADAMLERGEHVFYVDYEDNARGIVSRLLAMGVPDYLILECFHYIRPDRKIDTTARTSIRNLAEASSPALVIVDGVTEAMTMEGLDLDNNSDAAEFYSRLPRYLSALPGATAEGPAVMMIDHVPKNKEGRADRYSIGAQHKLAGLDGVMFVCKVVVAFSPGHSGYSQLVITKDRHGLVKEHCGRGGVIAEMHIMGDRQAVSVEFRPPESMPQLAPRAEDGTPRPTAMMGRLWRYINANPGVHGRNIRDQVTGSSRAKGEALQALVSDGWIRAEEGPRRSTLYTVVRVWNVDDAEMDDSGDEHEQEELDL